MKPNKAEINKASKAIASAQNMHRFCASFLATAAEGFKHPILFANEEAQDWVFRTGTSWPGPTSIPPGTAGAEQLGVVYAHDVKNGKTKPIYGMGRHNHESAVAIPGFDDIVVLSGDDTFQTNPPASSQLYMYTAADSDELWDDAGTLHAFVADGTPDNDYFDLQVGDDDQREVPPRSRPHRQGQGPGRRPRADACRSRLPELPGCRRAGRRRRRTGRSGSSTSGATSTQHAERADAGNDVFDFIRLEDIAYDKNDPNVVYLADSGRATARCREPADDVDERAYLQAGARPDGTGDPTEAEISILVQGDDSRHGQAGTRALGGAPSTRSTSRTTSRRPCTATCSSRRTRARPTSTHAGSLNTTSARLWKVPLCRRPRRRKVPLLAVDQALDENAQRGARRGRRR